MNEPIVIDKFTFKIMKYLYRHDGVEIDFIKEKFGICGFKSTAHIIGSHLACVSKDNKYSYDLEENEPLFVHLTIHGNAYVENRLDSSRRWFVTTIISLFALASSIIPLVIK